MISDNGRRRHCAPEIVDCLVKNGDKDTIYDGGEMMAFMGGRAFKIVEKLLILTILSLIFKGINDFHSARTPDYCVSDGRYMDSFYPNHITRN